MHFISPSLEGSVFDSWRKGEKGTICFYLVYVQYMYMESTSIILNFSLRYEKNETWILMKMSSWHIINLHAA